jgi:hypothetical protein
VEKCLSLATTQEVRNWVTKAAQGRCIPPHGLEYDNLTKRGDRFRITEEKPCNGDFKYLHNGCCCTLDEGALQYAVN